MVYREPIAYTYCKSGKWANIKNFPKKTQLTKAFKEVYKELSHSNPVYGYDQQMSEREWWCKLLHLTLHRCNCTTYSPTQFDRFFRRVYQHFGAATAYEKLSDGCGLLAWLKQQNKFSLGVVTNAPQRTVESVLPALNLHEDFDWFVSASDVGHAKPSLPIFEAAFEIAKDSLPDLQRCEVLHIGNDFASDYCGARAAGFQAILVDRSLNSRVHRYEDWYEAPYYDGKDPSDLKHHTVRSLLEVQDVIKEQQVRS